MILTSKISHQIYLFGFALLAFHALLDCGADEGGAQSDNRPRIIVLGDSLAAGYGLNPDEAYPAVLQRKIDDDGLNFTVVNAGVSGDTTAGGLRRIDWILKQPIQILILELGGNDGLRGVSPEVTKTNLQSIIDRTKAKYPDARIIIAGMRMPANMGQQYAGRFASIFAEVATQNHAVLVPFLLEGLAGNVTLNQADRIHPTAEGQKILAENIWKALKPVLGIKRTGSEAATASKNSSK